MNSFIDLVVCKHKGDDKGYLFFAPAFSGLEEADNVIVDTKNGYKEAVVQCVTTEQLGSNGYNFILRASNAYAPLRRVISKVTYREMVYGEVNNG